MVVGVQFMTRVMTMKSILNIQLGRLFRQPESVALVAGLTLLEQDNLVHADTNEITDLIARTEHAIQFDPS